MPRFDLSGQSFGSLVVLSMEPQIRNGRQTYWFCRCKCGAEKWIRGSSLVAGSPRSCLSCAVTQHGYAKHGPERPRIYHVWQSMIRRCHKPINAMEAKHYRDKGVKVCDRWMSFTNFLEDMGFPPDGHCIDRIDNNGDYEPSNCRWVTPTVNNRNKPSTKLNTEAVKVIRYGKYSAGILASLYGISLAHARGLRYSRQSWKEVV